MPLYKRKVYSGSVLEQEVYNVAANTRNMKAAEPKPPSTATEEERRAHREAASCKRLERLLNANYDPRSYYVTFTLDDEHIVDNYKDADRIFTNFSRRLRYTYPDAVMTSVMGRGKKSGRIHFHAVISGADEAGILERWNAGKICRIEHLREHNFYDGVDFGCNYKGLAKYLFDHWTPEQGGKRWKQTGKKENVRRPDIRKAEPVKKRYSVTKPPAAPKGYELVSCRETIYGYQCFTYARIPKAPMRC